MDFRIIIVEQTRNQNNQPLFLNNPLTKVLYAFAFCFAISQSTLAQQQKSTTAALNYGYGTADAPVITIGSQVWLVKNLNVDRFANGDPIPEAKTEEEWTRAGNHEQAAWTYYNNDPANGLTYGKLYNWHAVNDPRGLVPLAGTCQVIKSGQQRPTI